MEKPRERMWPVSFLYLCITWRTLFGLFFSTSSAIGLDLDSGTCQLRGHFNSLNGMHQNGDLVLGGLFEVHFLTVFPELSFTSEPKQPYCEQFDMASFQQAMTMVFAIEEINRNPNLLPNVTLGYYLYDNCVKLAVAFRAATALISGTDELASSLNCTNPPPVIGIVGDPGSTHSIAISSVLGLFRVPMVSYFATCSCLTDRHQFPSFFRTIPSDAFQVRAIVQILKRFSWTWVGLVYSNDDYGIYAAYSFHQDVQEQLGGCVAYSEMLPRDNNRRDVERIVRVIKTSTAKVVVVISTEAYLLPLMDEVSLRNVTGKQWIASEAWATSPIFLTPRLLPFLGGTLGIAIRRGEIAGLRDFLLRLRPDTKPANNMVRIFWEEMFGCRFDSENMQTAMKDERRLCTGNEDLSSTKTAYSDMSELRASYNVYKAVYALAHALHDLTQCQDGKGPFNGHSCAKIVTLQPWQVVHYLQRVNFTTGFGDHVSFDKNGDPLAIYDVMNWKPSQDGSIRVHTVDTLECTACPDEFWSSPEKDRCVPKEVEFLSYEEPLGISLTTASLFGTCFCTGVLIVFVHHRHTPVVRANNSELSFLLLLSLKLCFLCVLLFIGQPQLWTCQLRHVVFGISFVLSVSSILVKTMVVVAVFKSSRPESQNSIKWFGVAQQRGTVLVLTALQVVICTVWLTTGSPTPHKNTRYISSKIVFECALGSVMGFAALLGYIGLLAAVSFLLAFLARNLPDNFNEAKFITFSMLIFCAVWITFVPAYVSSPGKYSVAVEVFAILASSFGLLVSYFATCSCLTDRHQFPSFFRTIPSDAFQVRAIVQILKRFSWTWVGLVYSNDDYGIYAAYSFHQDVQEQLGGCVAYSEMLPRDNNRRDVERIVRVIKTSTAKVVVVISTEAYLLPLMDEVSLRNVTGKQWIASEAWATSPIFLTPRLLPFLGGTLGIAIRRGEIAGLRDFLLRLRPDTKPANNMVRIFWEEMFGCRFDSENMQTAMKDERRLCTGNEDLSSTKTAYSDMSELRASYNVYKAVYALAHALHDLTQCQDGKGPFNGHSCAKIVTLQPWQVVHYLQRVNFTTGFGDHVSFDKNGDPLAIYDVMNWKPSQDGSIRVHTVGVVDEAAQTDHVLTLNEDALYWNFDTKKPPRSVCSESCPLGTRRARKKGMPICCFDCLPCADGEISNTTDSLECIACPDEFWSSPEKDRCVPKEVEFLSYEEPLGISLTTASLFGTCFCTGVLGVFVHHRHTPVVRANNSELSFLLLLSLKLCFLCVLLFIGQPQLWTCQLRHVVFGISFVLSVSSILVKTMVVVAVFKSSRPESQNSMKWFGVAQQRGTVLVLTALQVVICTVWLTTGSPTPHKNTRYISSKIVFECALGSVMGFAALLGYIGLLAAVSFLLAFLARNLPDNFNEAKFITFSMLIFCAVWITFVPAYVSSPGKYSVAVEVFAILASSFGLLVAIFAPKCYIILLHPERNTKKAIMSRATQNQ
ncbi:extracellular calcium-sensing receptor [Silurus asotus]|uniref:Extracellular calcium-sensing receptor n=1 Tax=Silurus asotus TaxID=30991 RepID=A0AAD5A8K3_SILAS|nr:extracellular calcium-sensing receptor [Silurus asotus]